MAKRTFLPPSSRAVLFLKHISSSTPKQGNIDGDGDVDALDRDTLLKNFENKYDVFDCTKMIENFGTQH